MEKGISEKKNSKGLIFTIIIMSAMLVLLSSYVVYENFFEKDVTKINKVYENRDWVYVKETKTTRDDYICSQSAANTMLPQINLTNTDAQKYNQELETIYLNTETKNVYINSYKSYLNSDILSFVLTEGYTWCDGSPLITSINFNVKTNKKMTLEDILNIKKMSLDTFKNKLNIIIDKYYDDYKNDSQKNPDGYYDIKDVNNTKNNVNYDNLNLFINEDNNISVIIKVYCSNCMDEWYLQTLEVE